MPIVLSYNDVEALGALAYQSGYAGGHARGAQRNQALLANIEQSRNRTAAALQSVQARREASAADNALRAGLAGQQNQYRYDALQQQREADAARLDAARGRTAATMAADEHGRREDYLQDLTRDQLQHQQELEEIQARAKARAAYAPSDDANGVGRGVADRDVVQSEMQRYGHLIPFGAGEGYGAGYLSPHTQDVLKQAKTLSTLPTSQIQAYVAARPEDPWTPYLRAVVLDRMGHTRPGNRPNVDVTPNRGGGGAMAEGRAAPGVTSGGGGAGGYGDLSGLSDDQLRQLAANPQMLERYVH